MHPLERNSGGSDGMGYDESKQRKSPDFEPAFQTGGEILTAVFGRPWGTRDTAKKKADIEIKCGDESSNAYNDWEATKRNANCTFTAIGAATVTLLCAALLYSVSEKEAPLEDEVQIVKPDNQENASSSKDKN